jgi:FAD/FMN-containing dehydrogenase
MNRRSARRLVVDDVAAAVEPLRLAQLQGAPLLASELVLLPPASPSDVAIAIDAHNGLADVDARLTLRAIGEALWARGFFLPLLRPWAAVPLWRLAIDVPFVVDALVQRGTLVTIDGDAIDTPRAPRHAAGPSLLHAVCGPTPLCLLTRATLRVVPRERAELVVVTHDTIAAAARAVVELSTEARAFAVDACAARVVVLRSGDGVARSPSLVRGVAGDALARRARGSRSISPGDVIAIEHALQMGRRVVAVPFMQRAAILHAKVERAATLLSPQAAASALAVAMVGKVNR